MSRKCYESESGARAGSANDYLVIDQRDIRTPPETSISMMAHKDDLNTIVRDRCSQFVIHRIGFAASMNHHSIDRRRIQLQQALSRGSSPCLYAASKVEH